MREYENPAETEPLLATEPEPRVPFYRTEAFKVVALTLSLMAGSQVSANMLWVAIREAQEGAICGKLYDNVLDSRFDTRCKNDDVQTELGILTAFDTVFGMIPGLLTSASYGAAADKYGRKWVMSLAVTGFVGYYAGVTIVSQLSDYIPVRWVWATCLIMFIGGGPNIFFSLLYTILSDVLPAEERLNGFFAISVSGIVGHLVSSPIAYWLMGYSHWITAWVAVAAMVIVLVCAILLPETLHFKGKPEHVDESSDSDDEQHRSLWRAAGKLCSDTVSSVSYLMRHDNRLAFLLGITVFTTLGASSQEFLQQYIAKRYEKSWREANVILSLKMVGKLLLIVLIMPLVNEALIKAGVPTFRKDLWITRFGVFFAVVAYLGFAFSPNIQMFLVSLAILALNQPYGDSLKSVMVVLAGESNTAMVFSVVAVLASVGEFISAPLMAWCFKVGMRAGGAWIGLPYIFAGCLWGIAALTLFCMSSDYTENEEEQDEIVVR